MSKQRSRKHGQEAGTGTHDAGPDAAPRAGDPGAEPQGADDVGVVADGDSSGQDGEPGGAEPQELIDASADQGAAPLPEGDGLDAGGDGGLAQQPDLPAGPAEAPGEADQVADPVSGAGTDPAVSEIPEFEERADDVDQAEEKKPLAPQDLAMIAAIAASLVTQEAMRDPDILRVLRSQHAGDRDVEMFAILDESPDLPPEAIIKFLDKPDMPIEAAEAFKACYVGMAAWVKAENVRLTSTPASTRPSRYEKHGREERVGAKIVDQAEKDRIARNQAGLAIGEAAAFDDQGKE